MTALAFIDTETTGLHPERLPWEIAVILRESDGDERELLLQIEDVDLSRADPRGLAVSRFFERHFDYNAESTMPCDVVPERRAAQLVEQYLRGAHIVGCVPNFDTDTLDAMLRRHRLLPGWHYHLIDVETLAVGHIAARGEPPAPPWKSDTLSLSCGVQPPTDAERHTAMGDARWVRRWYDALMTGGQAVRTGHVA
jgi:hypothetical protein